MDSLSAYVQTALAEDPFNGQLFVFRGRRADRLKILWHQAQGLCLYYPRLEERDGTVETLQLEVERLKIQLARLRRWKFGRSSEQMELAISQIELTLEGMTAVTPEPLAAPSPAAATGPTQAPRRHRPVRRA